MASSRIRVEVVRAWPHAYLSRNVELEDGASVADAITASGIDVEGIAGYAIFGQRAEPGAAISDGDRVELLPPLVVDPKEARRKRARGAG